MWWWGSRSPPRTRGHILLRDGDADRQGDDAPPRREVAVGFGLTAAYATSHELLLFADPRLQPNGMADAEVARALTDLYLRILDLPEGNGS